MSKRKSAGKTATGRPFRPGPDPRRGRGPAPGEGGRPPKTPEEIREALRLGTPQRIARLEQLAEGEDARIALEASKYLVDRDLGKPTERVQTENASVTVNAVALDRKALALEVLRELEGVAQETQDRVVRRILGQPEPVPEALPAHADSVTRH